MTRFLKSVLTWRMGLIAGFLILEAIPLHAQQPKPSQIMDQYRGQRITWTTNICPYANTLFGILATIEWKAARIQARAKPDVGTLGPLVFLQQLARGQRPGRFVAVNAGGQIKPSARRLDHTAQCQQIQSFGSRQLVNLPAKPPRRIEVIAQDLLDIDGFAKISALVPAEALDGMSHADNLT